MRSARGGGAARSARVVIVAADHGEELLEHGWIGHNVQVYEPIVHVPLIVRFPQGTGPRKRRVPALGRPARPRAHDRRRLRRARARAAPTASSRAAACCRCSRARRASRRCSRAPSGTARSTRSATSASSSSTTRAAGKRQLYDLETDPSETRDVAPEEPLRTAYYRQTLHTWTLRLGRRGPGGIRRGGADLRAVREPALPGLHPGGLLAPLQVVRPSAAPCPCWPSPRGPGRRCPAA